MLHFMSFGGQLGCLFYEDIQIWLDLRAFIISQVNVVLDFHQKLWTRISRDQSRTGVSRDPHTRPDMLCAPTCYQTYSLSPPRSFHCLLCMYADANKKQNIFFKLL
jgi:hypothetical protein